MQTLKTHENLTPEQELAKFEQKIADEQKIEPKRGQEVYLYIGEGDATLFVLERQVQRIHRHSDRASAKVRTSSRYARDLRRPRPK